MTAPRSLRMLAALALAAAPAAAPAIALGDPIAGPPAPPASPAPAAAAPAPPAPIPQPPSFELRDRGDAVEVIAHNLRAARTAIMPVRSRLEVPLVGVPSAKRVTPGDATVKLIELDGENGVRVLSVKLGFEREDVKALSRFAQAIQVGDDLHLLVPRKLPSDGVVPRLPGPTLPPALAAAVAQIDRVAEQASPPRLVGPPAPPAPAPPPARAEARPAPAPPPARAEARPAPAAAAAAAVIGPMPPAAEPAPAAPVPAAAAPAKPAARSGDRTLKPALASEPDDVWSKISMYGALGLAAAAAGVWWMRRRRGTVAPSASIEVIAQRSLGGKARILWLSAGPREMIVSVTGQQVRLLGQWRKTDAVASPGALAAAALPAAHTFADAAAEFRPEPTASKVSPAVSGILRLRGRTGQMPVVSDAVATGDAEADDLWAREILAATGTRS